MPPFVMGIKMRKSGVPIKAYNTTLPVADIALIKALGGSAWIRKCLGIERARLVQETALNAVFEQIRQGGFSPDTSKAIIAEFSVAGENYRVAADPAYIPQFSTLTGEERDKAIEAALKQMRLQVTRTE